MTSFNVAQLKVKVTDLCLFALLPFSADGCLVKHGGEDG